MLTSGTWAPPSTCTPGTRVSSIMVVRDRWFLAYASFNAPEVDIVHSRSGVMPSMAAEPLSIAQLAFGTHFDSAGQIPF